MNSEDIYEGVTVFWHDPDANLCSGFYDVVGLPSEDVVTIENEDGSLVEVPCWELSWGRDD